MLTLLSPDDTTFDQNAPFRWTLPTLAILLDTLPDRFAELFIAAGSEDFRALLLRLALQEKGCSYTVLVHTPNQSMAVSLYADINGLRCMLFDPQGSSTQSVLRALIIDALRWHFPELSIFVSAQNGTHIDDDLGCLIYANYVSNHGQLDWDQSTPATADPQQSFVYYVAEEGLPSVLRLNQSTADQQQSSYLQQLKQLVDNSESVSAASEEQLDETKIRGLILQLTGQTLPLLDPLHYRPMYDYHVNIAQETVTIQFTNENYQHNGLFIDNQEPLTQPALLFSDEGIGFVTHNAEKMQFILHGNLDSWQDRMRHEVPSTASQLLALKQFMRDVEEAIALKKIQHPSGGFDQYQVHFALQYFIEDPAVYVPTIAELDALLRDNNQNKWESWVKAGYNKIVFSMQSQHTQHQFGVMIDLSIAPYTTHIFATSSEYSRTITPTQHYSTYYQPQRDKWSCGVHTIAEILHAVSEKSVIAGSAVDRVYLDVNTLSRVYYRASKLQKSRYGETEREQAKLRALDDFIKVHFMNELTELNSLLANGKKPISCLIKQWQAMEIKNNHSAGLLLLYCAYYSCSETVNDSFNFAFQLVKGNRTVKTKLGNDYFRTVQLAKQIISLRVSELDNTHKQEMFIEQLIHVIMPVKERECLWQIFEAHLDFKRDGEKHWNDGMLFHFILEIMTLSIDEQKQTNRQQRYRQSQKKQKADALEQEYKNYIQQAFKKLSIFSENRTLIQKAYNNRQLRIQLKQYALGTQDDLKYIIRELVVLLPEDDRLPFILNTWTMIATPDDLIDMFPSILSAIPVADRLSIVLEWMVYFRKNKTINTIEIIISLLSPLTAEQQEKLLAVQDENIIRGNPTYIASVVQCLYPSIRFKFAEKWGDLIQNRKDLTRIVMMLNETDKIPFIKQKIAKSQSHYQVVQALNVLTTKQRASILEENTNQPKPDISNIPNYTLYLLSRMNSINRDHFFERQKRLNNIEQDWDIIEELIEDFPPEDAAEYLRINGLRRVTLAYLEKILKPLPEAKQLSIVLDSLQRQKQSDKPLQFDGLLRFFSTLPRGDKKILVEGLLGHINSAKEVVLILSYLPETERYPFVKAKILEGGMVGDVIRALALLSEASLSSFLSSHKDKARNSQNILWLDLIQHTEGKEQDNIINYYQPFIKTENELIFLLNTISVGRRFSVAVQQMQYWYGIPLDENNQYATENSAPDSCSQHKTLVTFPVRIFEALSCNDATKIIQQYRHIIKQNQVCHILSCVHAPDRYPCALLLKDKITYITLLKSCLLTLLPSERTPFLHQTFPYIKPIEIMREISGMLSEQPQYDLFVHYLKQWTHEHELIKALSFLPVVKQERFISTYRQTEGLVGDVARLLSYLDAVRRETFFKSQAEYCWKKYNLFQQIVMHASPEKVVEIAQSESTFIHNLKDLRDILKFISFELHIGVIIQQIRFWQSQASSMIENSLSVTNPMSDDRPPELTSEMLLTFFDLLSDNNKLAYAEALLTEIKPDIDVKDVLKALPNPTTRSDFIKKFAYKIQNSHQLADLLSSVLPKEQQQFVLTHQSKIHTVDDMLLIVKKISSLDRLVVIKACLPHLQDKDNASTRKSEIVRLLPKSQQPLFEVEAELATLFPAKTVTTSTYSHSSSSFFQSPPGEIQPEPPRINPCAVTTPPCHANDQRINQQ